MIPLKLVAHILTVGGYSEGHMRLADQISGDSASRLSHHELAA
jgi:hypothetical protein